MKKFSINFIFGFFLFILSPYLFAHSLYKPTMQSHTQWMFMGTVSGEAGEIYGYYFNLDKKENQFHVRVILVDKQTQQTIFEEDQTIELKVAKDHHFVVGDAFLRFNPINNRWVLGIKHKDKSGFNFKIDMLKPSEAANSKQKEKGYTHYVTQTSTLNGYIQLSSEKKEQFVTSNQGWFLESLSQNIPSEALTRVFCRFDSGGGFYAMTAIANKAKVIVSKGWLDKQDKMQTLSALPLVKKVDANHWQLHLMSPKLNLTLKDNLQDESLMLGFIEKGEQGFCLQSKVAL